MPNYTSGTVAMVRNFAYYWHTKVGRCVEEMEGGAYTST